MSLVTRIVSPHARPLRAAMPEAERLLWARVRNRQLMNHKFRRQHSIGPYVADFACVEARLVVELDGSQHGEAVAADARRTAYMEAQGWRVVRFWNDQVKTAMDDVLRTILAHL